MTGETHDTDSRLVNVTVGVRGKSNRDTELQRIVWGLVLIAGGVMFMLDQLGTIDLPSIWKWWPAVFFAIGVPRLMSRTEWPSGVSMFLLGILFFALTENWQGLTWRTGWPLFMVIAGLEIVLRSFSARAVVEEGPHA